MRGKTTDRFDTKFEGRDDIYMRLSQEMAPYFVGPIPPKKFLDHFLPEAPSNCSSSHFEPGMFSQMSAAASEVEMYYPFVHIHIIPHSQR